MKTKVLHELQNFNGSSTDLSCALGTVGADLTALCRRVQGKFLPGWNPRDLGTGERVMRTLGAEEKSGGNSNMNVAVMTF